MTPSQPVFQPKSTRITLPDTPKSRRIFHDFSLPPPSSSRPFTAPQPLTTLLEHVAAIVEWDAIFTRPQDFQGCVQVTPLVVGPVACTTTLRRSHGERRNEGIFSALQVPRSLLSSSTLSKTFATLRSLSQAFLNCIAATSPSFDATSSPRHRSSRTFRPPPGLYTNPQTSRGFSQAAPSPSARSH